MVFDASSFSVYVASFAVLIWHLFLSALAFSSQLIRDPKYKFGLYKRRNIKGTILYFNVMPLCVCVSMFFYSRQFGLVVFHFCVFFFLFQFFFSFISIFIPSILLWICCVDKLKMWKKIYKNLGGLFGFGCYRHLARFPIWWRAFHGPRTHCIDFNKFFFLKFCGTRMR